MDNNDNGTFSIVVTSYTTENIEDIKDLFASIKVQTYPDIETIFVAERSRELFEEVKDIGREVTNLKVIYHDGKPGISAARNVGIKESRGDIIAFTDDDAVLYPRWAEESMKTYTDDDQIIGLTGPIIPQWEEPSMSWFPQEFYWIFACTYYDWTEPREVRNGYGTNISFRREAFNNGNLFPGYLGSERGGENGQQNTTAEEMEFSLRVREKTGKRIVYSPGVSIQHKVHRFRLTGKYVRRRAFIEGCSKMLIKKLYKNNGHLVGLLDTEYALLKRILFRRYPGIFKEFFQKPVTAWRKFYITTTVLSSVAVGYLSYTFKNP